MFSSPSKKSAQKAGRKPSDSKNSTRKREDSRNSKNEERKSNNLKSKPHSSNSSSSSSRNSTSDSRKPFSRAPSRDSTSDSRKPFSRAPSRNSTSDSRKPFSRAPSRDSTSDSRKSFSRAPSRDSTSDSRKSFSRAPSRDSTSDSRKPFPRESKGTSTGFENRSISELPSEIASDQASELSKVRQVMVDAEYAGQRLDNFLINLLKGLPKTRIYRIIRKGEVRVNKGRIKPDYRVAAGDIIRIPPIRLSSDPLNVNKSEPVISAKVNERLLSQILFEDEGLIILNKPSGMAVHGGSGLSFGVIEALRILRPDCHNLELVHRLDRETSGCLMIAKRRSTLKWLHELLRTGQIEKRYLALVKGVWRAGTEVNQPLQKNLLSSGERMVRVKTGGQVALTAFRILESYGQLESHAKDDSQHSSVSSVPIATLMEASPITGRTHQIRVHAEYAGNPVAGDSKYGDEEFNREMKKMGLSRLFLHAKSISIPLPDSQDCLTIEAPLEGALSKVLLNLSGE